MDVREKLTMAEYKCGDCFHADLCAQSEMLVGFSRDNPAYCCMFLNSADVAPVVRCKDCIHSYDDLCGLCCTCGPYVDCVVQPEFYCADGKRKEDK